MRTSNFVSSSFRTGTLEKFVNAFGLTTLLWGYSWIMAWPAVSNIDAGILLQGVPAGWTPFAFGSRGFPAPSHWNCTALGVKNEGSYGLRRFWNTNPL